MALRFFLDVKDNDDLIACVAVLEPEGVRAELAQAFRRFAQSTDMLLPDPRALPYVGDAKWLGKIREAAAAKYRDTKIEISDCGAKVRKLIEEAVIAEASRSSCRGSPCSRPSSKRKLHGLLERWSPSLTARR